MRNRLIALCILIALVAIPYFGYRFFATRVGSLVVIIQNPLEDVTLSLRSLDGDTYFPLINAGLDGAIGAQKDGICRDICGFANIAPWAYILEVTGSWVETSEREIAIIPRRETTEEIRIVWRPRIRALPATLAVPLTWSEKSRFDRLYQRAFAPPGIVENFPLVGTYSIVREDRWVAIVALSDRSVQRAFPLSEAQFLPRETPINEIALDGETLLLRIENTLIDLTSRRAVTIPTKDRLSAIHPLQTGEKTLIAVRSTGTALLYDTLWQSLSEDPLYDDIIQLRGVTYGLIRADNARSKLLLDSTTLTSDIYRLGGQKSRTKIYSASNAVKSLSATASGELLIHFGDGSRSALQFFE